METSPALPESETPTALDRLASPAPAGARPGGERASGGCRALLLPSTWVGAAAQAVIWGVGFGGGGLDLTRVGFGQALGTGLYLIGVTLGWSAAVRGLATALAYGLLLPLATWETKPADAVPLALAVVAAASLGGRRRAPGRGSRAE